MNLINYSEHVYDTAFRAGLKPDENLTVSAWAEKYRYLSTKASAEPGPWRTSRVPFTKEIMDCLSARHPAQKVVFMKGSQIAGTEVGLNWLGYLMDQAPGPVIYVTPNERMAERNSKTRVAPMIEECPQLRRKVRSPRSKDSGNTVLTKEFPGGFLAMVGANAPANLRMMPCRYAMLDEVDAYPGDVGGEGDPVELVVTRTRTFSRRKIFIVSTPTIKDRSRIEREFLQTDQRYFFVPCPHCNFKQTLKFANLKYEKDESGKIAEVFYICEECGATIEEHEKTRMLENGEWRAEKPQDNPKNVGFHLNSLYSPVGWFGWEEICTLWELAQRDVDKLKVVVNTIFAETWELRGEAPAWETIYRRREKYKLTTVPMGGLFLTAGVDVQKDRLEIEVVAWGREKNSYSVDYQVILGDTSTLIPWSLLDKYLDYAFPHEAGVNLSILRMGIDSGFNTQEVYSYCRKYNDTLRVMATKGQESLQTPLGQPRAVELSMAGKKFQRALKLWLVGTSILKSELYRNLRQDPPLNEGQEYPYGYCHFPEYGEEFFKQLTAEELITKKNNKGYTHTEWQKKRERNEALDCRIIARAMAASLGYDRMTDKQFSILERQLKIQNNSMKTDAGAPQQLGVASKAKRRGNRSAGLN
jgi:phage terminase large subunit GpA-like protein